MKRYLIIIVLMYSAICQANWSQWSEVGHSELTWGPLSIYQISLLSPSGAYPEQQWPLALIINYNKSISSQVLVDTTREQWQQLGLLPEANQQLWFDELNQIWPDVKPGQQLAFVTSANGGQFYFSPDAQSNFTPLGRAFNRQFRDAFLAIWFSEQSQYPEQRKQLMGIN